MRQSFSLHAAKAVGMTEYIIYGSQGRTADTEYLLIRTRTNIIEKVTFKTNITKDFSELKLLRKMTREMPQPNSKS